VWFANHLWRRKQPKPTHQSGWTWDNFDRYVGEPAVETPEELLARLERTPLCTGHTHDDSNDGHWNGHTQLLPNLPGDSLLTCGGEHRAGTAPRRNIP